jgi:rhamnosyltransferase
MFLAPAISFVAYYPDRGVLDRIGIARDAGFTVYVFDNTPGGSEILRNGESENINLMGTGENLGLGAALHLMMQAVTETGFSHVFYFDQDTVFTKDTMQWLRAWLDLNQSRLDTGAIWNFTHSKVPLTPAEAIIEPGYLLVSSGSLFNLSTLKQLGWHNPKFFLECIDYELCSRALCAGFSIAKVEGCVGIDHLSLQPRESLKLLGREFHYRIYSLARTGVFLRGLLTLALGSFYRRQWVFGIKCLRNILTHVAMQIRALVLHFLRIILGRP